MFIFSIIVSPFQVKFPFSVNKREYTNHPKMLCAKSVIGFALANCPFTCIFFTFSSSSPEPSNQFQLNLAQNILGSGEFEFVQIKRHALFQWEKIAK